MYGWFRDRDEQRERWHRAAGRVSIDQRNRDDWLRDARRRRGIDPDSGRRPPRTAALTHSPSRSERDIPLDYQRVVDIDDYDLSGEDDWAPSGSRISKHRDTKSMYGSLRSAPIYEDDDDEKYDERSQLTSRARSVREVTDDDLSPKTIRPSRHSLHHKPSYEVEHDSESERTPPPSYHLIEPARPVRSRAGTVGGSRASSPGRPPRSRVSQAACSRVSGYSVRSDFRHDEHDDGDAVISPPRYGVQRRAASLATSASRRQTSDERRDRSSPSSRSRARSTRDEGRLRVPGSSSELVSRRVGSGPSAGGRRHAGNSLAGDERRSVAGGREGCTSIRSRWGDEYRNRDI